ncbi:hypothetical protein GCM10028796_05090 [Ramlibacter monticola]
MSRYFQLLPLAALSLAAAAAAQSPPAAVTGGEPQLPVAPMSYSAPLSGYQPFSDEQVQSWRDANDMVGRIGGWREYARESQQSGGAAPASVAPASAPAAPTGHDGHANH